MSARQPFVPQKAVSATILAMPVDRSTAENAVDTSKNDRTLDTRNSPNQTRKTSSELISQRSNAESLEADSLSLAGDSSRMKSISQQKTPPPAALSKAHKPLNITHLQRKARKSDGNNGISTSHHEQQTRMHTVGGSTFIHVNSHHSPDRASPSMRLNAERKTADPVATNGHPSNGVEDFSNSPSTNTTHTTDQQGHSFMSRSPFPISRFHASNTTPESFIEKDPQMATYHSSRFVDHTIPLRTESPPFIDLDESSYEQSLDSTNSDHHSGFHLTKKRGYDSLAEESGEERRAKRLNHGLNHAIHSRGASPHMFSTTLQNHHPAIAARMSPYSEVAPKATHSIEKLLGIDFDNYMRLHVNFYEEAKTRWSECSPEEWHAGSEELTRKFNEVLDEVAQHMKSKMALFLSLQEKIDSQKRNLGERSSMLSRVRDNLIKDSGNVLQGRIGNPLQSQ